MDENKCILCNGENIKKYRAGFCSFFKERMFGQGEDVQTELIYCPDCDFYYSSIRPTDEQQAKYYSGYKNDEYQKRRQYFEPDYTPEFNYNLGHDKSREGLIDKFIKDYISNANETITNVLDYGGDSGQYIPHIFKDKKKYIYDVSGAKSLDDIICIDNEKDLKNIKWDFILLSHVIEHVSNPLEFIEKVLDIMPIGCYLYIEVPYETYMKDDIQNQRPVYIHEHIDFFRTRTFDKLFTDKNICVIANKYTELPIDDTPLFKTHIQCLVKKIELNDNNLSLLKQQRTNLLITEFSNVIKNDLKDLFHNNDQLRIQNQSLNGKIMEVLNKNKYIETILLNILEKNILQENELSKVLNIMNKDTFIQRVFSIKNRDKHKVIRIFGFKIKIRRKV